MKKIILVPVLLLFTYVANAQAVTSLNENFNSDCVLSTDFPSGWLRYNPLTSTIPWGQWTCTPTNGRPTISGTPTSGMQCTDTFSNTYHLDTSYLITPLLNLSSYSSIFLQFDLKVNKIVYGADLSVLVTTDTAHPYLGGIDITDSLIPLISITDSSGWVTHVVNLTSYKVAPFYITFRYTSTDTSGSIWFLDNVSTTTTPIVLRAPYEHKDVVQLTVLGFGTESQINFSYTVPEPGVYRLGIFDMVGKEVYHEQLNAQNGKSNYTINGLNLRPGMYFLKVGNEYSSGITKVMIE